jgi:hypothetical protein
MSKKVLPGLLKTLVALGALVFSCTSFWTLLVEKQMTFGDLKVASAPL